MMVVKKVVTMVTMVDYLVELTVAMTAVMMG